MVTPSGPRNQIIGLLFVGVLMAALDIAIVGPALPELQRAFAVAEHDLAWVLGIYVLFNLVGTPLMANLSNRFGRRAIYIADVGLFALGSALVAVAPSFGVVLLGRAIQGLGAGGIFPVATAVVGDTFPPERRGTALGLLGAVFGLAFLVGPIVGGLLLLAGWQWLFLVNIPIAALVIIGAWRVLPSHAAAATRPFDYAGMLLLAVVLVGLSYALTRIGELGERAGGIVTADIWLTLAVGVLACPALIAIERRAADPIVRLALFRNRQITLAAWLSFGAGIAEAIVVFIPALLVTTFHVSGSTASFMLLPMVLAMAVGSPASGRALDRVGSRAVIVAGTVLLTVALVIEGLLLTSIVGFYLFSVLFGLGLAILLGAALRYIMLNEAGPEERAPAQSLLTIFINAGQLIGAAALGGMIAMLGGGLAGYQFACIAAGSIMALLALLATRLKSRGVELATRRDTSAGGSAA
ncbi:MAG: MFS transporter [Chloroflexi bacterium]|nr:MFS transporter [Chloroflexota bacterium]